MQPAWAAGSYGAALPASRKQASVNSRGFLSAPGLEAAIAGTVYGVLTFASTVSLCALASFRNPGAVNAACLVLAAAPAACLATHRSGGAWRLPVGLCGLAASALGAACGAHAYAVSGYFSQLYAGLRTYPKVDPYQRAGSVADGGRLLFAPEARLDVNASAGFLADDGSVYCASPVLGIDPPRRVEFWAVGVDCCAPAGGFECGAALHESARAGAVLFGGPGGDGGGPLGAVLPVGGGLSGRRAADEAVRRRFDAALRKAESALGVTASPSGGGGPVLLTWMDAHSLRLLCRSYSTDTIAYTVLASNLFACLSAPLAWLAARRAASTVGHAY